MLYTHAITRRPGENFHTGITSAGLGLPRYREALHQHDLYVKTLGACGLDVRVLEPDLRFPDGCFVEDTAVIIPEAGIITNPGAASRKGEETSIASVLKKFMPLQTITSPGTMDGGDVLRVEKHFFVGLSGRTNGEGIEQFQRIVRPFGYVVTAVPLSNLLHLKSGIAYVGGNALVAVPELINRPEFAGYTIYPIDPKEAYAVNCLRVDDKKLLIAAGFAKTKEAFIGRGEEVIEMEVSEFQKMDGGLTCLSLLF